MRIEKTAFENHGHFEIHQRKNKPLATPTKETLSIGPLWHVNYIFENITYDVLTNPGKFKKCEISLDIVKDNTKYKLS